ncbi:MAG: hypothetical protein IKI57_00070 [Clostridia bacterium]|nr:hypothetical protein [Clostridia bacterium]
MKLQLFFDKSIRIIGSLLFLWIVILLVGFENIIEYSNKREQAFPNIIIIIVFALVTIAIMIIKKKKDIVLRDKNYDKPVKVFLVVFFIMQVIIFYNIYFETGWDSFAVSNAAREIAYNNELALPSITYLSQCPNNILITLFYTFILKLNLILGLFKIDYDLMSIIVINCLISSYTSYLIYKIGKKLFNNIIAFIGYLVSVVLLVFSPWNAICYSDALALFLPVLMISLYIDKKTKYYIKYPLLVFFGYMTYLLKPQSAIIFIAILIVEVIRRIPKINAESVKKGAIIFAISLVPIVLLILSFNGFITFNKIELDKEKELGITHYLMVGANKESNGAFSYGDAVVSKSIETKEERTKKNIELFFDRMNEYGIGGYSLLLCKKLLTLYNDGTFAWGYEGDFFWRSPENNSFLSKLFKGLYHESDFIITSFVFQIIWMFCIMSVFINLIVNTIKNKAKIDYLYLILITTIIGLTIFELIFEVRARYLYSSVPIYIILTMYAIYNKWGLLDGNGHN